MAIDPQVYAMEQAQHPTTDWAHQCQKFVRTALGFAAGVPGGGSANSEYEYTKLKGNIRTDTAPPPNVPVYFGGLGPEGHVALSAGGGNVWSTDINGPGTVSLVSIDDVKREWGATYLGYGLSEGDTRLAASTGASPGTADDGGNALWNKLPKDLKNELTGMGVGAATVLTFFGLKKKGGAASSLTGTAAKAAGGAATIVAAKELLWDNGFIKRAGAAVAGALLILFVLWKLSGATAVPIPV